MTTTRRRFLKIAAIAGVGLSCTGAAVASYLPDYDHVAPNENAKTAKRWGMLIDTKQFQSAEDYKPLIEACHMYHNVPEIEGKQEIKWLWTDSFVASFPMLEMEFISDEIKNKQFPLLCNHCKHPPCVKVCPTKATFKRPDGIVIMDMHRCIGCRYCMAGCPYGSRSFNFQDPRPFIKEENLNPKYVTRSKGVVEKCNFCAELLAEGKNPLCVEAARGKILFGDLNDPQSEIRKALAKNYAVSRKAHLGTEPSVFYII